MAGDEMPATGILHSSPGSGSGTIAARQLHCDAVAPVMKLLKVQRMIIYLFDRGAIESCRANLEFQDEDSPTDYEDDVCSLPYTWDGKLKKDVTCLEGSHDLFHRSGFV